MSRKERRLREIAQNFYDDTMVTGLAIGFTVGALYTLLFFI